MSDCACACHVNPSASCTIDGGYELGCGPHDPEPRCVLPHPPDQPAEPFLGLVCRRHYHWIGNALTEIVTLWALRDDVTDQKGGRTDVRVQTSSVHSPAPGRLDFAALTDPRAQAPIDLEPGDIPNVAQALQSWVDLVFTERGITAPNWRPPRAAIIMPPRPTDPTLIPKWVAVIEALRAERKHGDWTWRAGFWCLPSDVASLVRILKRERRWIAAQDWVDDFASELGQLHRAVASAVGETMWAKPLGVCPNCRRPLFVEAGVDAITCRNRKCNSTWEGVHYLRLRLMIEQQDDRGLRAQ